MILESRRTLKKKIKMLCSKRKLKCNLLKLVGINKSSAYREIYSTECLYFFKKEKSKINHLKALHIRKIEKENELKSKISRRKEIKCQQKSVKLEA